MIHSSTRTPQPDDPSEQSHSSEKEPYRIQTHAKRDVPCPACAGIGVPDTPPYKTCRYCGGDGRVSRERADIIERQLASRAATTIG
jgi:DnaJ-class molecular chaperone